MVEIELKWKRKPVKSGRHPDDYVFSIPRTYIRNELIDPNQLYQIKIEPIKDKKV